MASLNLPEDPLIASKVVDHEAAKTAKQLEGGVMGRFFGFATEKPGNIAAFVLIISFMFLGGVLVWERIPKLSPRKTKLPSSLDSSHWL